MFKDKKILAGGAVLFAAAFWFYIKPNYMDAKPAPVYTAEQVASAPRPTVILGKPIPGEGRPTNSPEGLILNLQAPATSPNYVKAVIALEFESEDPPWVGVKGAALEARNAHFAEELQPEMHKILDAVATVVGSKTAGEVSSTEGREHLKAELIEAINHHLPGLKVEHIYFETFITQ